MLAPQAGLAVTKAAEEDPVARRTAGEAVATAEEAAGAGIPELTDRSALVVMAARDAKVNGIYASPMSVAVVVAAVAATTAVAVAAVAMA